MSDVPRSVPNDVESFDAPSLAVDATITDGAPLRANDAGAQTLDFEWHEVRRIDHVAVPRNYWLTRRLPLTLSVDGVDGTIELWGIPAMRPVRWDPTDTRHYLFHGWIAGAERPRGVGILRVVRNDGVVLGQLGFEGSLIDMQRRPIPSASRPSFVLEIDNAIGMGSWTGVRSHVISIGPGGPAIESATRDADGSSEPMSFLMSLKCDWRILPGHGGAYATIGSRCCDRHISARGVESDRDYVVNEQFRFDGVSWRAHREAPVRVDMCPEPI